MTRLSFLLFAVILAIAACTPDKPSPNPVLAAGASVENFTLPNTDGVQRSLEELKGKNGAILVFVSAQCPTVKQYNERISQFAADFAGQGINVIGINSNSTESLDWVLS